MQMRASTGTTLAIGLALVGLAACSNKLSGSANAKGDELGEFSLTPDECYSGERESFYGVQLEDKKSGNRMRVVKTVAGEYQLVVNVPGHDKAATFTQSSCSKFDVAVERQNSRINDIYNVEGRVMVDCAIDKNTFSANITFANCH